MVRLRKKDRAVEEEIESATPEPVDARHQGPWDSSEKSPGDDPAYIDLGALQVRGRVGVTFELPADGENGAIGSVVLVAEGSALELRAFAATRSGGLWAEVRADLVEEVGRLGGEFTEVDGPFGPELKIAVPTTSPAGEDGLQPSRIIGIEGPRWLLRATVLGEAALEPGHQGLLLEALRDVIIVRGAEPRIPREPLLLTLPENVVLAPDED